MTIPPINPDTIPSENPNTPTSMSQPATQLPTELELLRAQVGQLTGIVQQLATSQQPRPQEPQYQPMQVNPDDWSDPSRAPTIMQEMIRREISQAVAPLDNFRKQFDRTNTYNVIKQQVKNSNPQLARYWNHIEPSLDATFGTGQIDVNPQLVLYQAQATLGSIMLTNPSLLNPTPAPATPMIPPSGATPPSLPNPSQNLRPLSDNEAKIARERGLTHEQYLQMAEGSAIVISPKFGKE